MEFLNIIFGNFRVSNTERLKNESIRRALSMNEILCRALIKELKMEDDLR